MVKRAPRLNFVLLPALAGLLLLPAVSPAQQPKDPVWKYGLEFRVRKADQPDFDKNTQKYGSEVFHEPVNTKTLYIVETGALAAAPGGNPPTGAETQKPHWVHGLKLQCRKGGAKDWTGAKEYGIEVFEDKNSGTLVYISEVGSVAVVKAPAPGAAEVKKPTWLHGLDLSVRKQGENDFTDKTAKFGIEVFKDENTGLLVYISETGAIAVAAGTGTPSKEFKNPKSLNGLELKVRKQGEKEFTNSTRVYGVETFRDENTNLIVYICETGSLSVVAAAAAPPDAKAQKPTLLQGIELKVRKQGEQDFTKETKVYGGEIFKDENTGNLIYICETGSLAAISAK